MGPHGGYGTMRERPRPVLAVFQFCPSAAPDKMAPPRGAADGSACLTHALLRFGCSDCDRLGYNAIAGGRAQAHRLVLETSSAAVFFLDRAKTGRPAAGTLSRWSGAILNAYLIKLGVELTANALIFRNRGTLYKGHMGG